MKVGRYEVTTHNHGFFRLDGGAMFGVVPKTLWARQAPPDDQNRILMATRSLVIQADDKKMLVDLGCGDKWNAKSREIFCIKDEPYKRVPGVTHVLLTHLHFDHCGGISCYAPSTQQLVPNYPDAKHFVSQENYDNARHPNGREKASYLPENVDALKEVQLEFTHEEQELWSGLTLHQCHGHTRGLQWVKLSDGGATIAFPTDVCPTAAHLPPAYVMGYDMCAEHALNEKQEFLAQGAESGWIVVFEHDPVIAAATVKFDDRGRAQIAEQIEL
jgi:glyoxylase-like metal-dependent hydrolase (beta-lactamase superfamily II)